MLAQLLILTTAGAAAATTVGDVSSTTPAEAHWQSASTPLSSPRTGLASATATRPAAPAPLQLAGEQSVSTQLHRLFQLHQTGGLTSTEFAAAKLAVLHPYAQQRTLPQIPSRRFENAGAERLLYAPPATAPHPGAPIFNVVDYGPPDADGSCSPGR
jgi:hypothetical protein